MKGLSVDDFSVLWMGIDHIEAQNQLNMLKAMDWPNMKEGDRKSYHKELVLIAFEKQKPGAKKLSNKELAQVLRKR